MTNADLIKKYPLLFSNKDPNIPINLFGIECKDGWASLLDTTFSLMYAKYNHVFNIYKFWQNKTPCERASQFEIDRETSHYANEVEKEQIKLPTVQQIKEKFGTLRLYCDNVDERTEGIIEMAEAMSAKICEVCGSNGERRKGGWIRTLCSNCNVDPQ